MTNSPTPEKKPAAEPPKQAEAQPAAQAAANAHPDAKKARPSAPPADPAKQKAQMVLIFVIVAFVGAGLMMIPGVRHAIFGGDGERPAAVAVNPALPGRPLVEQKEQPRQLLPMGQFTQYFGKPKAFAQEDGNYKRIQYYYLYAPQAPQGARLPLVVFLHDEEGMAPGALSLLQLRKYFPAYILVMMAAKGKTWAVPEKFSGEEFGKSKNAAAVWSSRKYPENKQLLPDVMKLVASLMEIYAIDDGRIYIAGCGEGALGVFGAAARYGEFFAGGAAASGLWSFLDAPKMTQFPLVIQHGGKDKAIDSIAANGISQLIMRSGGKAVYQEIPDLDRNCADPRIFGASVWKWLFAQKKAPLPMGATP